MQLSKYLNPDPQSLGIELARTYGWQGEKVFLACLYALEDSNYHRVSRALIEAWEKIEGELNAIQKP